MTARGVSARARSTLLCDEVERLAVERDDEGGLLGRAGEIEEIDVLHYQAEIDPRPRHKGLQAGYPCGDLLLGRVLTCRGSLNMLHHPPQDVFFSHPDGRFPVRAA